MKLKNPKAKGSRNERRMRDWLEARGYSVTKAGGSLGCWDLIGHLRLPPIESVIRAPIAMVQVKSRKPPGPAERRRMEDYAATHRNDCVSYWIAYWKPHARQPTLRVLSGGKWEKIAS